MTVIITAASILGFGLLSKPKLDNAIDITWKGQMRKRFKDGFIDGIEVVLFVFFLTMDSTKLFFLPKPLNIPLHAEFKGYDLMVRSFVYNSHLSVTVALIVTTISLEVLRYMIKIFAGARRYYLNYAQDVEIEAGEKKGNGSTREVKPEQVIPFDEDLRDF